MITRNKNAELQLLSWICLENKFVDIPTEYLYGEIKDVYEALKMQYINTGAFDETVLTHAHRMVVQQSDDIMPPRNVETIVDTLRAQYRLENAYTEITRTKTLLECNPENFDEYIISLVERLTDLKRTDTNYFHDQSILKYLTYLEEGMLRKGIKGIRSNLVDIDNILNGWQHGKMYAIGGLKKTGKSRFAINLSSQWLNDGLSGIFCSMEMMENDIHNCILGNRCNINTANFGTSRINTEKLPLLKTELEKYKAQDFYISRKSALTPLDVKNMIMRKKHTGKCDFVVVDYIQRMDGIGTKKHEKIAYVSEQLSNIARDENVILIVLSQLSGEAEKNTGSTPLYAFFKESQAIIEACDVALVLYDKNRGNKNSACDFKCLILQREGVSDIERGLHPELQYSRFSCLAKQDECEW